jgi:pilus assembly protein CpaF
VDHALVKRLRGEVGDRLAQQRRMDAAGGVPPMSGEDERQFARALIAQALESHARAEITAGRSPLTAQQEEDLAEAVHAALFGVGRLQPLLEDQQVENIDINGCDRVFIGYADGREVMAEPVAESDEELIELIQTLAAYSGLSSRPFDTANPQLDLRLPDGSRLSAVMDVTLRPAISIRRARMGKVFLADLVRNGTMTPELASFLSAAVLARKNIMIAGSTNAGKTTLLRALANQIPPEERLITVERALELGLDHFPELHPNAVAFEERLPNSEGQGAVSMAQLVRRSLRMNPSRVIVGEVLGDEIVTMLNAMTQGNDGSLSTIHANSSLEVFNRIATYAIQATERLPIEATHMLIAGAVDFVVFQEKHNDYAKGGRLRRFVSSVREVTGIDGRVLSSEVFAPGPDGRAVPHAPVSCVAELAHYGYAPVHALGGWLWVPSPQRRCSRSWLAEPAGPGCCSWWSRSAVPRASRTRRARARPRSGCATSWAGAARSR